MENHKNQKEEKDVIFSVFCPYLKRTITLKQSTWYTKIIKGHPEVDGKQNLVCEVLSKNDPEITIYKKKDDPEKIAVFKQCQHFLPYNRYLKIALRLINNDNAVVTTVHGVYNLPSTNAEKIK